MNVAIETLQKEIRTRQSVLNDKTWGTQRDELDDNYRTHRQILNSEIYYFRKALKILTS